MDRQVSILKLPALLVHEEKNGLAVIVRGVNLQHS